MLSSPLGRTGVRFHFALVLAVALTGVGLLLMITLAMFGEDAYSRDMAVLALVITTPLWLLGLVAAVDAVSVLRGRRISRIRALVWALVALAGGALLAVSSGQASLVATMLARPDLVGFDWPAFRLITADLMGVNYLYVDQPGFWLPPAALVLGSASLIAVVLDGRGEHRSRGRHERQVGSEFA
jgi:hypothetical protein